MRFIINSMDDSHENSLKKISTNIKLYKFSITNNLATFEVMSTESLEGLEGREVLATTVGSLSNVIFHVLGKVSIITEVRPGLHAIEIVPSSHIHAINKFDYRFKDKPESETTTLDIESFNITQHNVTLTIQSNPDEVCEVTDSGCDFTMYRLKPLKTKILTIQYDTNMAHYVHVDKLSQYDDKVRWNIILRYTI